MARPAKQIDIISNYGEVVTTTVKEFVAQNNMSEADRTDLYKKTGWMDDDGNVWRVGQAPEFNKTMMYDARQRLYNMMEADYLFFLFTGKNRTGVKVEQLKSAILNYNHQHNILETQNMTNLYKIFTGSDELPSLNLETYRHQTVLHGRKGSLKEWTSEHTLDKFIFEVEAELAA